MERLANASSRDGRMAPSTTSKKDSGVVTLLGTAERQRDFFFCLDGSFSLRMHPPSSPQGFLEVFAYFNNYLKFKLILLLFFYSLKI